MSEQCKFTLMYRTNKPPNLYTVSWLPWNNWVY